MWLPPGSLLFPSLSQLPPPRNVLCAPFDPQGSSGVTVQASELPASCVVSGIAQGQWTGAGKTHYDFKLLRFRLYPSMLLQKNIRQQREL